jgi:hypothetical protein
MQLHLAPSAHAFGHQGACIFGHGPPPDLQQEMGLRVLSQRPIEELGVAPHPCQFFQ